MEAILLSWLVGLGALLGMAVYSAWRQAGAVFFESFFFGLFLGLGLTAIIEAVTALSGGLPEDNVVVVFPIACAACGWLALWVNLRRTRRFR